MGYWDCTARDKAIEDAKAVWDAAEEKWLKTKKTYDEAVRIQDELKKTLEKSTIIKDGYSAIKDSMTSAGEPISSSSNMEIIDSGCVCVGDYFDNLSKAITKCDEQVKKWEKQLEEDDKDADLKAEAYEQAKQASCDWIEDSQDKQS